MNVNAIPHYIKLTRLDRPIGISLLMWPTLTALWLAAEGFPDLKTLLIFIAVHISIHIIVSKLGSLNNPLLYERRFLQIEVLALTNGLQ